MKLLVIICFIAAIGLAAAIKKDEFGTFAGTIQTHKESVKVNHISRGHTEIKTAHANKPIVGMVIIDNLEGAGAHFKIVSGGVGHNSVTVELKEENRGIDTDIFLFGKKQ